MGLLLLEAGLTPWLLEEHDAQWYALHLIPIMLYDEAVEAGFIKLHALEVQHHIPCDEGWALMGEVELYWYGTGGDYVFILWA